MPRKKSSDKQDRMIHIRLTDSAHRRLRVKVAEQETTIQDWVADIIVNQLQKQKKGQKKDG